MPYEVREQEKGFRVCKKGSRKCYSNDPLPLNRAERQLKALYSAEADMEGAGFFGNLLKRTFTGITDMIVKPRGFDPSKHTQGWLRRPFDMPPLEDLAKIVASTYKKDDAQIQGYIQVAKTDTVSFFQVKDKRNIFIIALRGTSFSDINDISADLRIVKDIVEDARTARSVRNSQRYIDDVATIKEFEGIVKDYLRIPNPVYYAVGHSLSGAMIDELLEDGLVSSAVSFNPAIERVNFAKDNNNHRVYLSCDVLYNLLGKFITNGNLEVVEKENPFGADASPIDASKGTIKCHNIETVIPLMSGKGIENNLSSNNKSMSFQDLINRSSSFRLDKFKPIGSPCDKILEQPITQDVGPNSGRVRQQRAYRECLERQKQGASGSGWMDTLGRIKKTIDEGARRRSEEEDRDWKSGMFGKIGIPNPMKLFGGAYDRRDGAEGSLSRALKQEFTETASEKAARIKKRDEDFYKRLPPPPPGFLSSLVGDGRPYTAAEWEAKLCKGEDSLLAKKKRAIDARAKQKATKKTTKEGVKMRIVRSVSEDAPKKTKTQLEEWKEMRDAIAASLKKHEAEAAKLYKDFNDDSWGFSPEGARAKRELKNDWSEERAIIDGLKNELGMWQLRIAKAERGEGGAYDRRDGAEGSLSRALKQEFTETASEKAARIKKRDEDFYKRFPRGEGPLGPDFD